MIFFMQNRFDSGVKYDPDMCIGEIHLRFSFFVFWVPETRFPFRGKIKRIYE